MHKHAKKNESNVAAVTTTKPQASTPDNDAVVMKIDSIRQSCVDLINETQRKIDKASGKADEHRLSMGKLSAEFIAKAKAINKDAKEDALLNSLCKDPACKVKKSALNNARSYYETHHAMVEAYGKAPTVSMTHYVMARNANLTLHERYDLLVKAEADSEITAAKLKSLVREALVAKGYSRKAKPTNELIIRCRQAFASLIKVGGLLMKGAVPCDEAFSLLNKCVATATANQKKAGQVLEPGKVPWCVTGETKKAVAA